MADRCPSCGRELGDILRTTYKDPLIVVHYEVIDAAGERTELDHLCGDSHPPD